MRRICKKRILSRFTDAHPVRDFAGCPQNRSQGSSVKLGEFREIIIWRLRFRAVLSHNTKKRIKRNCGIITTQFRNIGFSVVSIDRSALENSRTSSARIFGGAVYRKTKVAVTSFNSQLRFCSLHHPTTPPQKI